MTVSGDFRLGADVVADSGKKVGSLVSVLVEENGFDPRALVVRNEAHLLGRLIADEKLFITDEVVVPVTMVESATHEMVRLKVSEAELKNQPPYLSYRFQAISPGEVLRRELVMLGGGLGIPNAKEVANKPSGQIEIDRGENVMLGVTGRLLGHVHDVLFDQGELIGVVVRPKGFRKQDIVMPVRFLDRGDDMALFADIDEAQFQSLQPFTAR
jgi:uncharacterized protein YrrD